MIKEAYEKHKNVINWFYNQPEGATVLVKRQLIKNRKSKKWYEIANPAFFEENDYLINDEYVELRKAIYEGKSIERLNPCNNEWENFNIKCPNGYFALSPENYRIKKDLEFPIYKKDDAMVVKFIDEFTMIPVFVFNTNALNRYLNIGEDVINQKFYSDINNKEWKDVLYDKERNLWNGQPVWCWDYADIASRKVKFYNVVNHCPFNYKGHKSELKYENYKAYEHPTDEWLIKAYNKLKF